MLAAKSPEPNVSTQVPATLKMSRWQDRLRSFFVIWDARFEDLTPGNVGKILYRDFSAGLIVALTAIPMAMGFAIASGLRPEQGIVAGAVACLIGRTFGGSKYQVYGPTAAFMPLLAFAMTKYDHGFLVAASVMAGVILMTLGVVGWGRYAKYVPNSIIVGFTAGIAVAIALSNARDAVGLEPGASWSTIGNDFNLYAVGMALATFLMCRYLLKISIFIPAPLVAIAVTTVAAATLLGDHGVDLVGDRFGSIPSNFFKFTPPTMPAFSGELLFDLAYVVLAIVFISGVESLLCSSMADRLAKNKGTPFDPNREFWGQGLVQVITPMVNGFPCTGALARTATSIKVGAVTPFAGYFKGILKLALAYFIAPYLEHIPMACIAGILLWVATNMFKVEEIKHTFQEGRFSTFLVVYTGVMVPATDFLTAVLSALGIYGTGVAWQRRKSSAR